MIDIILFFVMLILSIPVFILTMYFGLKMVEKMTDFLDNFQERRKDARR